LHSINISTEVNKKARPSVFRFEICASKDVKYSFKVTLEMDISIASAICIFITGSCWECLRVVRPESKVVKSQRLLDQCCGLQVHLGAPVENLCGHRKSGENQGSTWEC